MKISASISTDILAIVALCLIVSLAKRNPIINNKKNGTYISISVLTIVLLILEILTILMNLSTNSKLVVFHRIANVLGFSLSPLVAFIFLMFYENNEERILNKHLLAIPLLMNSCICILSYNTGWIFFVDPQNQYYRGKLFLLPSIVSGFYFILSMIAFKRNIDEYEIDNKKLLVFIFFMPILGVIIQIIYKDILLIWGCMAISLLLYYILMREHQIKYDIQTGIKNRVAFEKEMEQYSRDDKNAAIIVLDINNLKKNNDNYGHKAGDEVIVYTAKTIKESFETIGKAFRIGGDEFCVICQETSRESVDHMLERLDNALAKFNEKHTIKIEIAYGYAFYNKKEGESIYSIFSKADKAMYENKARLKGCYGR